MKPYFIRKKPFKDVFGLVKINNRDILVLEFPIEINGFSARRIATG